MKVCVYGLGHLGRVTAACIPDWGHTVIGLDEGSWENYQQNTEPLVTELLARQYSDGHLTFTNDAKKALSEAEVLWVTFDTPIDKYFYADTAFIYNKIKQVRLFVQPKTLIVISSQVPVGFTNDIWDRCTYVDPTLDVICVPENLRHGQAIMNFRNPARVLVGSHPNSDKIVIETLFGPLHDALVWMSLESAEMTKHALNTYLALSITFANELNKICRKTGAKYTEVEQGLRTDPRIGQYAYVGAGPVNTPQHLLREINTLFSLAEEFDVLVPLIDRLKLLWNNHP